MADFRLVVVHVARAEDRHFSRRARAIGHRSGGMRAGLIAKACARVFRQHALAVHAQRALQQRTSRLRLIRRIHELDDDGNGRQFAQSVGTRQHMLAHACAMLAELQRLRPELQVREVDVPWVRRDVRTFRHVTHVAEIAPVDDVPVAILCYPVELTGRTLVDQIEERRKGRAEIYASPASVADTVYPLELREDLVLIVELRRGPVERVPGRCV